MLCKDGAKLSWLVSNKKQPKRLFLSYESLMSDFSIEACTAPNKSAPESVSVALCLHRGEEFSLKN